MSTPSQLDAASKCYCFNDAEFKRVVAYLLDQINSGGGGGTVQDMQVAWTPTNLKLGQLTGFTTYGEIAGITSITFNQTTSQGGFDIEGGSILASISFPNLVSIDLTGVVNGYFQIFGVNALTSLTAPLWQYVHGGFTINGTSLTTLSLPSFVTARQSFDLSNNALLSTLSLPVYVPNSGINQIISGCNLSASSVNAFLARCVANAGYVGGTVDLSGGTSAAPSGQGIADKATLIGRGVTVNTN